MGYQIRAPNLCACVQEVLSQFAALGANNARGSVSMPPTKLITLNDERTYGKELINLFRRAAREHVVPSLDGIRHTILSKFAELRAGIARGTITLPSPQDGVTAFGKYKLDEKISDFSGLVEFSPLEYAAIKRNFKGEKIYNATPILFLGRGWKLTLGTVNDQIYKLYVFISLPTELEADSIVTKVIQHCKQRFGSPSQQNGSIFLWDKENGGNVVLQATTKGVDEFLVALFLTSASVRHFQLL